MKRRTISVILFVLCVLLTGTFAIYAINNETIHEQVLELGHGNPEKGSLDNILSKHDELRIVDDIEGLYDLKELLDTGGVYYYCPELTKNASGGGLQYLNELFPIEYIRQLENNQILVVYKTKDPSNKVVYLYCFFEDSADNRNRDKNDIECWRLSGFPLALVEGLSFSNFESIEVGSSIYDVYDIDPVVATYFNIDNSYPYNCSSDITEQEVMNGINKDGKKIFHIDLPPHLKSYHLLTDGLLTISYELVDETLIVSGISYSEDYKMYDPVLEKEVYRKIIDADMTTNMVEDYNVNETSRPPSINDDAKINKETCEMQQEYAQSPEK